MWWLKIRGHPVPTTIIFSRRSYANHTFPTLCQVCSNWVQLVSYKRILRMLIKLHGHRHEAYSMPKMSPYVESTCPIGWIFAAKAVFILFLLPSVFDSILQNTGVPMRSTLTNQGTTLGLKFNQNMQYQIISVSKHNWYCYQVLFPKFRVCCWT